MYKRMGILSALVLMTAFGLAAAFDEKPIVESFAKSVGDTKFAKYDGAGPVPLPYLTWGGDVATFYANGGLETTMGSIFGKQGIDFKLTNGDDFTKQVRDYMSGKTPYLRGTFTMIGQAAELLNSDAGAKPITILQLTWSAGDHMVGRAETKNLNDIKGKKICLQQGGPHVGLVDDALRAAGLKWSDITVVWAKDLSGPNGPAELFKKDKSIDLCCVISPDMIGLTGGLDQKGSGAEETVKGAHVVVSTASMSRSIADVYCVRSDYFAANRAKVQKFVAGYLKATNDLIEMKKKYADGKGKSPEYLAVLKQAQKIYGVKILPTIEVDAHGLVSDATFVGLPGNISFFTDSGNLNGFAPKLKTTLDLMTSLGATKERAGWDYARWDYEKLAKEAGIEYVAPKVTTRIKGEGTDLFPKDNLDDKTILSFSIYFEPNQTDFSIDTYSADFRKVVQNTQTFGNAVIVIRGHADPTKSIVDFLRAGMKKGIVSRSGDAKSGWKYQLGGKDLNLNSTSSVVEAIGKGDFSGTDPNPQETMQAAMNLSQERAELFKKRLVSYAKANKINLDVSQVVPQGVGIREPVVAKPANMDDAKKNMRVEFRLIRVSPENIKPGDFDY